MANASALTESITARIATWVIPPGAGAVAVPVVRDNMRANTLQKSEFIRITALTGAGFLFETVGIRDVRGSTVLHSFVLRFNVFTMLNSGAARADELAQSICDHWQVMQLAPDISTSAASINRIGEEAPHYHTIVDIGGRRQETLDARP